MSVVNRAHYATIGADKLQAAWPGDMDAFDRIWFNVAVVDLLTGVVRVHIY